MAFGWTHTSTKLLLMANMNILILEIFLFLHQITLDWWVLPIIFGVSIESDHSKTARQLDYRHVTIAVEQMIRFCIWFVSKCFRFWRVLSGRTRKPINLLTPFKYQFIPYHKQTHTHSRWILLSPWCFISIAWIRNCHRILWNEKNPFSW